MNHKCERDAFLERVEKTLFGNGQRGLGERVARLEVVTVVATLIIAGLQIILLIRS